jgi:hypothetical protein
MSAMNLFFLLDFMNSVFFMAVCVSFGADHRPAGPVCRNMLARPAVRKAEAG